MILKYSLVPGLAAYLEMMSKWVMKSHLNGCGKEKSWSVFYQNVQAMSHDQLPSALLNYVALSVFEDFLCVEYPNVLPPTTDFVNEHTVTKEDLQVLHYVGGAILRKLRKASNDNYLPYIEALTCGATDVTVSADTLEQEPTSSNFMSEFTRSKDRGGLMYMHDEAVEILGHIESIFRNFVDKSVINVHDFVKQCSIRIGDKLVEYFHVRGELIEDDILSDILHDICSHFFNIRIHHRCKIMKEKLSVKKTKGLRKTLKMKAE